MEIAFVEFRQESEEVLILVSGIAKSLQTPAFMRNYDTEQVIGEDYARPIGRSIAPAELTLSLKEAISNDALISFCEVALKENRDVTLMVLSTDYKGGKKIVKGEFFSGLIGRPGRNITPDKAEEGEIKMQVSDFWRTENGVVKWRLPKRSLTSIDIKEIYA